MWLLTRYGFFSVVQARQMENGKVTQLPDPQRMMIRARDRSHLENLRRRFSPLATTEILETSHTDYRYRMIVSRQEWLSLAGELAQDVDYGNFKGVCGRSPDLGSEYNAMLHDVWARGLRLGGDA